MQTHKDTSGNGSPESHGDVPTHALAGTATDLQMLPCANTTRAHVCFAHVLRRPVTTVHPTRAWHIQNPCSGSHACARTFLQTCTAGDPHALAHAGVRDRFTLLHFTVI